MNGPAPRAPSGQLFDFAGVAVDRRGDVYVTNVDRSTPDIYDPSGRMLASWTGLGPKGPRFTNPGAGALDSHDDIFLIDGTRILELTALQVSGRSGDSHS